MLVKASLKAKTIQCYLKFSLSTSRFFQYRDIRKFRRNSWHIFYILFGLMQSKHKRKELSFILELWSMIKGAVHNFHLSKTNFLHKISLMQLKKKKKSFLFVNTDMRNLVEEYFLPCMEEVKDLIFLKLYLLYHTIWLRVRISQAIIKCVFIAISGMYTYCEYCSQKLWKSWTTPELNCCTSKENWAVYNDFNREDPRDRSQLVLFDNVGIHEQTNKYQKQNL